MANNSPRQQIEEWIVAQLRDHARQTESAQVLARRTYKLGREVNQFNELLGVEGSVSLPKRRTR
jgi:hypothetical protein